MDLNPLTDKITRDPCADTPYMVRKATEYDFYYVVWWTSKSHDQRTDSAASGRSGTTEGCSASSTWLLTPEKLAMFSIDLPYISWTFSRRALPYRTVPGSDMSFPPLPLTLLCGLFID